VSAELLAARIPSLENNPVRGREIVAARERVVFFKQVSDVSTQLKDPNPLAADRLVDRIEPVPAVRDDPLRAGRLGHRNPPVSHRAPRARRGRMAGPILKRANALVWLPPRGDGRTAPAADLRMPAFVRDGGAWIRQDASIEALAERRSAVLLVDARDTVLLTPKLPPLSGAKLAQALPNAVEDMLLTDPAACVLALGPTLDDAGTRLVVACDRAWLEAAVQSFEKRGVAVLAVWPASLSLPLAAGGRTLACLHDGLALRRGEVDAIGWPAGADEAAREAAVVSLMQATWKGPASAQLPLQVLVQDDAWREPVARAAQRLGLHATIEPLAPPVPAPIELLAPLRGRLRATRLGRVEWREMRWAAGLAAACALATVAGLNAQWRSMSREQVALRASLEAKFREAVPGATVIVDRCCRCDGRWPRCARSRAAPRRTTSCRCWRAWPRRWARAPTTRSCRPTGAKAR
jgi:general secretion pathway protein L